MPNRTIRLLKLLAALLFCGHIAAAQTCGGGTRIIEVRTPNGQLVDSLRYEVVAVPDYYNRGKDSLEAFRRRRLHGKPAYPLSNYLNNTQPGVRYGQSALVPLDTADLAYLQRRHFLAPVAERAQKTHDFAPVGAMPNGTCRFKTYEGPSGIYVLKLSTPSRSLYLISKLFTGCGYKPFVVIWSRSPHLQEPPLSWQETDLMNQEAERKRTAERNRLKSR